ncbi:ATP-dependent RNA helicase DHX37-like protein [Quillaja saponaria]|uniref:ATP-dependent RNA helicase DHX37-like protein n=1 Tax=Quillaja saponaria TaxID=32244 RepID=A0AAD7L6G2_QUISA|nr:ATP-dependent RNA helicase DHX37-like protein [Quillaja saponaria]
METSKLQLLYPVACLEGGDSNAIILAVPIKQETEMEQISERKDEEVGGREGERTFSVKKYRDFEAETVLEKRRRAEYLLKEGLEVPHGDEPLNKSDDLDEIEAGSEEIHSGMDIRGKDNFLSIITDREVSTVTSVSLDYTQRLVYSNGVATDSGSLTSSYAEVSTEIKSSMPNDVMEGTKSVDKADESFKANLNQIS